MARVAAGSEVDAWCTRCRLLLGHTVIAVVGDRIARVRCETCKTEHAFRGGPPGEATGVSPKPRAVREPRQVLSFDAVLAGKDTSKARRYIPSEKFGPGEVLQHPSFGLGLVQTVRGGKVEVLFRVGEKILVHGLGAPPPQADKAG